jgi:uncharacterized membrane protein YdjX (TVP38/TMEM64 family)
VKERLPAIPPPSWLQAVRAMVLLLLLLGAGAVGFWHRSFDPLFLSAAIGRTPAAPLLFLAVQIAASLLFLPRTLLAIVAGLAFGMGWGLFWAACGSLLGAIAGFLLARFINRGLIDLESMRRIGPYLERAERGGWRTIAALRLVPIMPHSLANYALGLSRIPLGAYSFGSFIGQLPLTVAYVNLGAAGERAMAGGVDWVAPTVIGAAALLLSLLFPALSHLRARRSEGGEA